jgi:hypothetical protein
MKWILLLTLFLSSIPAAAGQEKADKKDAGTKAAAPREAAPQGVPKGAERVGAFEWRYTDKEGKAWVYRKTPFGWTKLVAPPETAGDKPALDSGGPFRAAAPGEQPKLRPPFTSPAEGDAKTAGKMPGKDKPADENKKAEKK